MRRLAASKPPATAQKKGQLRLNDAELKGLTLSASDKPEYVVKAGEVEILEMYYSWLTIFAKSQ